MLKRHRSGWFAPGALSALQKFKVKSLDHLLVTLTNCGPSVGERVGNENSNSN
jgi:hypothetical protein